MRRVLMILVLAGCSAGLAAAQDTPHAGLQNRDIKALSQEQIEGYLAGHGMGFALAAELNGYPGPKHVLELAEQLSLSGDQVQKLEQVFAAMQSDAQALGEKLVSAEGDLDKAFDSGNISSTALRGLASAIAEIGGELRVVHLAAHIETRGLLREEQIHEYSVLRGYGRHDNNPHRHGSHGSR